MDYKLRCICESFAALMKDKEPDENPALRFVNLKTVSEAFIWKYCRTGRQYEYKYQSRVIKTQECYDYTPYLKLVTDVISKFHDKYVDDFPMPVPIELRFDEDMNSVCMFNPASQEKLAVIKPGSKTYGDVYTHKSFQQIYYGLPESRVWILILAAHVFKTYMKSEKMWHDAAMYVYDKYKLSVVGENRE